MGSGTQSRNGPAGASHFWNQTPIFQHPMTRCLIWIITWLSLHAMHGQYVVSQLDSSAERILGEHLRSLGDRAKLEQITSARTTGKLEFAGSESVLQVELIQAEGKYLLVLKSDELEIRQGFDGETVWETSPSLDRLLEGSEKIAAINQNAKIVPALSWLDGSYDGRITLTGRQTIEDRNCFVVLFEPTGGTPIKRFFDPETYLIRRMQTEQPTDVEPIEVLVKDSDWRPLSGEFAGVQFPFRQQSAANRKLVYTLTRESIEINLEWETSWFAIPEKFQR